MLGAALDLGAAFRQRLGDRRLADHLAHRALGGRFDGQLRVADVEEVGARVLDHPEDGKVDVDDVLVAGQHQRLFRHLTRGRAARALAGAVADLGAVDAGDAGRQHGLDRIGQVVVEARLRRPVVGAEAQHDADLVGLHAVEAADQPDDDDCGDDDGDTGAGAEIARQQPAKPVLPAAQQLLEIGRLRAAAARWRPPPLPRLPPPPQGPPPRGPPPQGPPP